MNSYSKVYIWMTKVMSVYKKLGISNINGLKGTTYRLFSKIANFDYLYNNNQHLSTIIDNSNTIVTLTTYGDRTRTVYRTLDSIFHQSVRPYKVILWLSDNEYTVDNLPNTLIKRMQLYPFFEVRFCKDLKSHKKYYETLKLYPNNSFITADDDVFYPFDWLETLLSLSKDNPGMICCTNAHLMNVKYGRIESYNTWERLTDMEGPSLYLCPVGIGGVLYPPFSLYKDVLNVECIIKTCINADDLWLRIMGILNKTSVVKSNKYPYSFLSVNGTQKNALSKTNVLKNKNDIQLMNILELYEDDVEEILK